MTAAAGSAAVSGPECVRAASGSPFFSWPGKGITPLAALPRGIDFQYSYAEAVRGGVLVLFDRYDCRAKTFDIAAVHDPG